MWSDRYEYYNIQSDKDFSQSLPLPIVIDCLLSTSVLKQNTPQSFANIDEFSWLSIALVNTHNGNYSISNHKQIDNVTLLAIVCAKRKDIDQQTYITLLNEIASILGWQLYIDTDDEDLQSHQNI